MISNPTANWLKFAWILLTIFIADVSVLRPFSRQVCLHTEQEKFTERKKVWWKREHHFSPQLNNYWLRLHIKKKKRQNSDGVVMPAECPSFTHNHLLNSSNKHSPTWSAAPLTMLPTEWLTASGVPSLHKDRVPWHGSRTQTVPALLPPSKLNPPIWKLHEFQLKL